MSAFSALIVFNSCMVRAEATQVSSVAEDGQMGVNAPLASNQQVDSNLPIDAKLISSLMKEQFKVVRQNSSNPFPVLVAKSNNKGELDPLDSQYQILSIESFEDKDFFRKHKIFLVVVNAIFLEARIKVAGRSAGLFALEGKKLIYLNGEDSVASLTEVLRKEGRSISQADPEMFSNLLAMTVLRQNNDRVDVVQVPEDILKLDRPNAAKRNEIIKQKKLGRFYSTTVDKAEFQRCKEKLMKAEITNQQLGWQCRFIGLRGFMHTVKVPFALIRYDISISPNFNIKIIENFLSDRIIL